MAFPVVQTADTKNGTVVTNSTSWTLTYPTNIAAGDLLVALVATDGTSSSNLATWPADWHKLGGTSAGGAVTILLSAKSAVGSETGNFTLSGLASEQEAWRIFRITNWYGGVVPDGPEGDGISIGIVGGGTDANPNPPSRDPANWATEDTLWIAGCAADTSRTVSAYPTNCPDLQTADVSGGAGGATLGVAMANSATASFDQATFTISAADDWQAVTIGVRPAAAAGGTTVYSKFGHAVESG